LEAPENKIKKRPERLQQVLGKRGFPISDGEHLFVDNLILVIDATHGEKQRPRTRMMHLKEAWRWMPNRGSCLLLICIA
jgi:hypothetical protein